MAHRVLPVSMLLLLVAASGTPPAAMAVTAEPGTLAPDSARVDELRARLRKLDRVRVVAGGETFLADGPIVSSEGIRFRSVTIRQGHTYRTLAEPRPRPWAEIESIHVQGHSTRNGALLGALLGGAIGLAIGAHQPCHAGFWLAGTSSNCFSRQAPPIVGGIVGGAALGALIAHRYERWRPVYP